MSGRELKQQIRERQIWDEELTGRMARVEVVVGDSKLLAFDETLADAGLSPDSFTRDGALQREHSEMLRQTSHF